VIFSVAESESSRFDRSEKSVAPSPWCKFLGEYTCDKPVGERHFEFEFVALAVS
jgi:hypothetical protein